MMENMNKNKSRMTEKILKTERGDVYYWIHRGSSKRCIVFCHGLTADHTLFDMQIEEWANEDTMITWDIPLQGKSRPYHDFTLRHAAQDLREILRREQIDKIVIAGQSAGGFTAQVFAGDYPEMVDAFVGIDTTPLGGYYYKKSELFWTRHYKQIAALYPYETYCKAAAKAATVTEAARQSFYECLKRLGKKAMLEAADSIYHDFETYDEVDFTCPVLLLLGEHDHTGYVERYNKMWSEHKKYPLVIIKDAGHNSNYDNYKEFNRVVRKFLEDNRR